MFLTELRSNLCPTRGYPWLSKGIHKTFSEVGVKLDSVGNCARNSEFTLENRYSNSDRLETLKDRETLSSRSWGEFEPVSETNAFE